METKVCVTCKEELGLESFCFRKDTGVYRGKCKQCSKGYKTTRSKHMRELREMIKEGLRKCSKCNQTKSISEFSIDRANPLGFVTQCKACKIQYARDHKDEMWNSYLLLNYGITLDTYNKTLKEQNNKCAICKTDDPKGNSHKFHVDHCHTTGKVRGLLCSNCNMSLGGFKDNITNLEEAIKYLIKSKVK